MMETPATAADRQTSAFSFFIFCVYSFILVGRPQDYVPALAALRPAVIFTVLAVAARVLLSPSGPVRVLQSGGTRAYLFFFLVLVVGVPFSLHRGRTFDFVILQYVVNVIFFLLFVQHVHDERRMNTVVRVFVLSLMIFSLLGLTQGTFVGGRYTTGSTMFDPNDVAFVVLSLLPFAVYVIFGSFGWLTKMMALGSVTSGVVLALYTGSRGGLLGLGAFTLLFLLVRVHGVSRARKALVVAVLVAAAAFNSDKMNLERYRTLGQLENDYNTTTEFGRVGIWQRGLRVFASRPFIGVGADRFGEAIGMTRLQDNVRPTWQTAHNSYVEVLTETGMFGGAAFLLLIIGSLVRLRRASRGDTAAAVSGMRLLAAILVAGFVAQLVTAFFLSQAYSMFFTIAFAVAAALANVTRGAQGASPTGLTAPAMTEAISLGLDKGHPNGTLA